MLVIVLVIVNILLSLALLAMCDTLSTKIAVSHYLICDHVSKEAVDLQVELSSPDRLPIDYFKLEFEELDQN